MFDFVAIWKVVSIISTAFFGVLGLLKDFKDKDNKKITFYGKLSLLGIVASALFGVAAQLKEQSEQEELKQKTAKQTLELVKSTQQSVVEIKRLVYKIGKPRIDMDFDYICDNSSRNFCNQVKSIARAGYVDLKSIKFDTNPAKDFSVRIDVFKDDIKFAETFEKGEMASDLTYTMNNVSPEKRDSKGFFISSMNIIPKDQGEDLEFSMFTRDVSVQDNNGRIVGIEDLKGAQFIISGLGERLRITKFELTTDSDIRVQMKIKECKYVKKSSFRPDGSVTAFNRIGEYINACRFAADQEIGISVE